jgi:hypothetical protein
MKYIFIFSVTLLLFIIGCKRHDDKIKVKNKLGKTVICVLGYGYPDLKLNFTNKQALLADTNLLQIDSDQTKELDTIGLCRKDVWDKYVKQSLLMLIVFDKKKLIHSKKLDDAVLERYYFSYTQLIKDKGVIVVY